MAALRFKSPHFQAAASLPTKPFQQHVLAAVDLIEERLLNPGSIQGISTGFRELDRLSDGFQAGEVFLIASQSGMGKTTFALNILEKITIHQKRPAALFGLEISASRFAHRFIIARSNVKTCSINTDLLKHGILSRDEMRAVTLVSNQLSEIKLLIDETPIIDIQDLVAKARRLKKEERIKIIVIDSLSTIISKRHQAKQHPEPEISEIANAIKGLAQELNVPILVFAQLQEQRNAPASIHDLHEYKCIVKRADRVALLTQTCQTQSEQSNTVAQAKLTLIKNHFGPLGNISLHFNPNSMRFTETEVSHSTLLI